MNQKLLGLNPSENSKLEVYEETHLLTENFNDGRLFNEITYRYMKNNKIPPKLQLSFFNRLGGGVTISDVYNQEKNSGSHLCITIIDSDKKHPTGDEGSTAKGFRKHLNKKWTYSGHHIMKDLSEIENLLPVMFYKNKSNGNLIKRLSKIDLSFYDLKCGLTAGILKDIDGYNHWSNHGVTLPAIEDIRKMDNKQQLMQGVGDQAMTSFLNKKGYKALIIGIKERDLSENQRNEHKAIAKLIFNWCVSSHPPRL